MLTRLVIIFLILIEQAGIGLSVEKKLSYTSSKLNLYQNTAENSQTQNSNQGKVLSSKDININGLPKPLPTKNIDIDDPQIEAVSACILDVGTNKILWEKDARTHKPMASTTKLMTTLVVLDECDLSDVVKISPNAISTLGDSMWLYSGEEVCVEHLLYGMLMASSNDASVALAEHISGSVSEFVKLMNQKAKYLGLTNTSFQNSAGFDAPSNYTTAHDLAYLTSYTLDNPIISKISQTQDFQFTSESGLTHRVVNSNKLLVIDSRVIAGKTGLTDEAGQCLANVASENGHKIITIILNSPDRFFETQKLIDWTFSAYRW